MLDQILESFISQGFTEAEIRQHGTNLHEKIKQIVIDNNLIGEVISKANNYLLCMLNIKLIQNQFEEKTWESFEMTGLRGIPSSVVAKQLNMSDESVRSAKSRIIKRLTDTVSKIRDQEDEGGSL